jgi:hemoglobin
MDRAKRVMRAKKIPINLSGVTLFERLGGRPGVSTLLKWFYAKVRFEPLLEPIFNAHIKRWSKHLEVLIDYWSEMTGGPAKYGGGMGRHIFLNLSAEHFGVWLTVWEENCHWLLPEPEALAMIELAQRLARELQAATIGRAPESA